SRSSGQAAVSVREVLTKVGAGVLCAGLFIIVWLKLRPAPYDVWGPHQTPAGAVGEALTYSPMGYPLVPVTVSVLAIVGVAYLLVRAESRWFLVGYGLVDYLYVVDAGIERGPLREFMTGIWYADANRLAALLPVFGVVLGALGLNALVAKSIAMARRVPVSWIQRPASVPVVLGERGIAGAVAFAVLIGGLVWLTQMKPLDTYIESGEAYYMRDTPTSVLSSDEYRLLERVPATVPADALIAGNPWNGSTLAFAFTGREVLSHHMFETRAPADIEVAESLDEAPDNEEACDAISESGVSYVLDFGTQYLAENDATGQYAGFDDLATSRAVRLVDEEGAAKLYEVVVCQD
ncbi:MAG: hypothetical protein JWM61_1320, partial [Micrococcaceae bacterium]|nr:hypothetical protein [Micrococcaceae bacterium]